MDTATAKITVSDLSMGFGNRVIQQHLDFEIRRGEIFVIMGTSGCGKSTLLRHLVGLLEPLRGDISYDRRSFTGASEAERQRQVRRFGVLFQQGALWSSLTVGENVALPIEEYTELSRAEIGELVDYKLSLVGLRGFAGFYPSELSGGMRKRAALARAMALDPEVLFFDEPSAGLDPVTSHQLDETIQQLRDSLGATVVIVSHELASIFQIGDRALFLDGQKRTMTALGAPAELLKNPPNPAVEAFLTRNHTEHPAGNSL